jgi:hypothetical protein
MISMTVRSRYRQPKIIAVGAIPPVAGKETGLRLRTIGVELTESASKIILHDLYPLARSFRQDQPALLRVQPTSCCRRITKKSMLNRGSASLG